MNASPSIFVFHHDLWLRIHSWRSFAMNHVMKIPVDILQFFCLSFGGGLVHGSVWWQYQRIFAVQNMSKYFLPRFKLCSWSFARDVCHVTRGVYLPRVLEWIILNHWGGRLQLASKSDCECSCMFMTTHSQREREREEEGEIGKITAAPNSSLWQEGGSIQKVLQEITDILSNHARLRSDCGLSGPLTSSSRQQNNSIPLCYTVWEIRDEPCSSDMNARYVMIKQLSPLHCPIVSDGPEGGLMGEDR